MIQRFGPAILAVLFTVASALAQQKTVTIATVNNPAMMANIPADYDLIDVFKSCSQ